MSVGPVSPTALSFRAPSSLPVIPCGVFLANGHGLRPPSGRISAVDARSFLRRNGHGLRPPSGRISAVDARSFLRRNGHGLRLPSGRISAVDARGLSPQTPLHQPAFPACVPKRGTGFFLLRPSSHRGAISESPSAAALFRYGRPSCRGTLCVHGYAAFPWPDRPQPLHPPQAPATMFSRLPARPRQRTTTAPLPEDGTAIRNRINVLGRGELTGWWPQDRGRQERRCSGKRNEMLQKGPSPRLPSRKEAP